MGERGTMGGQEPVWVNDLPPVVTDPDWCCERVRSPAGLRRMHQWRRGESFLGWLLSWIGLSGRYPIEVCRYCGGRKP